MSEQTAVKPQQQDVSNASQTTLDGLTNPVLNISDELTSRSKDVKKLSNLAESLVEMPPADIIAAQFRLRSALDKTSGFTKRVTDHAQSLHADFMTTLTELKNQGQFTPAGYTAYLKQGWYQTSYTPRFELRFAEHLTQHFSHPDAPTEAAERFSEVDLDAIEKEEGHELWALQDIQTVGLSEHIDVYKDIFPETKAIVWSQHDRLSRLPFIGFLGYAFYLELFIALHAGDVVDLLRESFGMQREDYKFIYFHFLVDQGHSVDNLSLLDTLIQDEQTCNEVIDNMNFIHTMYKGFTVRSFTAPA